MANYHSPTVIQQMIPTADMTALEQLLLGEIFDAEFDGEAVYLCTDEGPRDMLYIDADKLREGVGDPAAADTTALSQIIDQYGEEILADGEVEIDASCGWWENILQDIVRRSATLDHLSVITSYTCDKMRADGFGGMATLITGSQIRAISTHETMANFIAQAVESGEIKPLG